MLNDTMEELRQEFGTHVFGINCDYTTVYFLCDCNTVDELAGIDLHGAIEETLHYLLHDGLDTDEVCTAMGLSYDYDGTVDWDDEMVCYIDLSYYVDGCMWSIDLIA